MSDEVNHPPHYTSGSMECIEAIEGLGFGRDFCRGNVIKYVVRFEHKNGLQDLMKARWYLDRLIEQETAQHRPKCPPKQPQNQADS